MDAPRIRHCPGLRCLEAARAGARTQGSPSTAATTTGRSVDMSAVDWPLILGLVAGSVVVPALQRRHQAAAKINCEMRVLSGSQPGLSRHHRSITAHLEPGRITFGRRHETYTIRVVEVASPRTPLSTRFLGYRSVQLRTPDALLEWKVKATDEWVLDRVRPEVPSARELPPPPV